MWHNCQLLSVVLLYHNNHLKHNSRIKFPFNEDGTSMSYLVIFPDLGHLATDGDTLDQAMKMAIDCLAGYLYAAKKDGEKVPAPSGNYIISKPSEYIGFILPIVHLFVSFVSSLDFTYWFTRHYKTSSVPLIYLSSDSPSS